MIDLFLKKIEVSYAKKDLSKIELFINQLLNICPIPICSIPENVLMERIRNNYKGEVFHTEEELSFRRDYWNIKEFGRANFPNSAKFYASLSSDYIKEVRIINVLETNKEFRQRKYIKKRQKFTSGQWATVDSLNVAIFPFSRDANIYNREIKFHSQTLESFINSFPEDQKKIIWKLLKFISSHFSKRDIYSHYDYSVSAYISELLFDRYKIDGIAYPSVRALYKSYNLVLKPEAVIKKLSFKNAAMFELLFHYKDAIIDNVADGELCGSEIFWTYTEGTSESIINRLLR